MHINDATSLQPAVAGVFAVTGGRLGAAAAAVIGLIGTGVGGLVLARSTGRTRSGTATAATGGPGAPGGLVGAPLALVLGLTAMALGGLFVVSADGGLGTGSGLGGAVVAMVLGLVATVLGGLARARGRQVA